MDSIQDVEPEFPVTNGHRFSFFGLGDVAQVNYGNGFVPGNISALNGQKESWDGLPQTCPARTWGRVIEAVGMKAIQRGGKFTGARAGSRARADWSDESKLVEPGGVGGCFSQSWSSFCFWLAIFPFDESCVRGLSTIPGGRFAGR